MGFLSMLGKLNPAREGVVPRVTESAEYFGASVLTGYLQNKYRDKASIGPVPAELFAGGVLKLGALAIDLFGKSKWRHGLRGTIHTQSHILGNVGLAAYGHTLGAGLGASASGLKRLLVKPQDVPRVKAAVPSVTVLGDIPRAPHGDYLSWDKLTDMSR